ncbi:MAG: double zinc ribbon domain-containing protein, partial [Nocardioidaceae bacterium]
MSSRACMPTSTRSCGRPPSSPSPPSWPTCATTKGSPQPAPHPPRRLAPSGRRHAVGSNRKPPYDAGGATPLPNPCGFRVRTIMRCESCGTTNVAGNRFCGHCGLALALVCATCGSPAPVGQLFCGHCGTPFMATAVPEPAAAPELRWASVLFADLVGYTSLTHGWDAEDVREML